MIYTKHPARSTETCLHFVCDEQCVMFFQQLFCTSQISMIWDNYSCLSLQQQMTYQIRLQVLKPPPGSVQAGAKTPSNLSNVIILFISTYNGQLGTLAHQNFRAGRGVGVSCSLLSYFSFSWSWPGWAPPWKPQYWDQPLASASRHLGHCRGWSQTQEQMGQILRSFQDLQGAKRLW